jgi:methionyl-tRNA formyltransferase
MRMLVLADGLIGMRIVEHLAKHFADDVALVAVSDRTGIPGICLEKGIPAIVYESEAQVISALAGKPIDLGLAAWWPRILREKILRLPVRGFVNTHPSLLPHNRGKHYNFWAIVEEVPFGVSLHCIDDGIDTGDVLIQQRIEYDWTDTGGTLYEKAQAAMMALFVSNYPLLRSGNLLPKPQDLAKGSVHYASELDAASKIDLDGTLSARALLNRLRARTFEGKPACWFEDEGVEYEVRIDIRRRQS